MKKIGLCSLIFSIVCSACMAYEQGPIPTHTPKPTSVFPTPYPTLREDLQRQFHEELDTNGGCELPCFLGVTPGVTALNDAITFFETYAYDRKMRPDPGNSSNPYQWYKSEFYIANESKDREVFFFLKMQSAKNVVVGFIIVFGPVLNPDRMVDTKSKLLERYGVREILQHHGPPDEIYINPTRTRQTQSAYGIEVIYNKTKILARYSGIARLAENGKYELCPLIGDGNIDSFNIALGNPLDIESDVIELAWGSFVEDFDPAYYRTHHQKLDPQAIYNLLITQNKRCFYEDEFQID